MWASAPTGYGANSPGISEKSGAVCERTELSTTTKRVQDRKQAAPILREFSANLLLLN
jgi:hypothetical protein